jgi:hypothetical protein
MRAFFERIVYYSTARLSAGVKRANRVPFMQMPYFSNLYRRVYMTFSNIDQHQFKIIQDSQVFT